MQLMAYKLEIRKHSKGVSENDQVKRINKIIGTSSSAEEALLKRCSFFDTEVKSNNRESSDSCADIIETRMLEFLDLRDSLKSKVQEAVWLFKKCEENHEKFSNFKDSIDKHDFGDMEVTKEVQLLIDVAFAAYNENDWQQFFPAKKAKAPIPKRLKGNGERLNIKASEDANKGMISGETLSNRATKKTKGSKAARTPRAAARNRATTTAVEPHAEHSLEPPRKRVRASAAAISTSRSTETDANDLPEELKEIASRLKDLCTVLRSEVAEWVCRKRALRFLETARSFQKGNNIHSCSASGCSYKGDILGEFNVLGQCGHAICNECIDGIKDRKEEECGVQGCRGSVKDFHIIRASELGLDDEENVSGYGGKKFGELVNLLRDTTRIPEEDRVIIFVQFEELMQSASKALTMAKIKHGYIGTKDIGTKGKGKKGKGTKGPPEALKSFQSSGVDATKVLILLIGGANSAGL